MTLPALYELAAAYRADLDKLNDLDLPPEVVADTLESIGGDLQEKCTNVGFVIRNMEALAAQIKDAEQQMAARRKAIEARAERVREYLLNYHHIDLSKRTSENLTEIIADRLAGIDGEVDFNKRLMEKEKEGGLGLRESIADDISRYMEKLIALGVDVSYKN